MADIEEPMELQCDDQSSTTHANCDEDEAQFTLSVQWSEGTQPQKSDKKLEFALQLWTNKNKIRRIYQVSKVFEDGRAVIKIKPSPDLRELWSLCGQTLNSKEGKTVRVMNITLTPPGLETQIPDNPSMTSPPPQAKSEPQDDEAQFTLSVQWSEGTQPQKSDQKLEFALQSWTNKNKIKRIYQVSKVFEDGRAVIKIQPSPDLRELWSLCGKTLNSKEGKTVTVMEITLTPPGLETQIKDNPSMTSPPPQAKSEPQDIKIQAEAASDTSPLSQLKSQPQNMDTQSAEAASDTPPPSSGSKQQTEQPVEQSSTSSPAADSTADEVTHSLALSIFWYLNYIYKKEIEDIMKKNRVTITSNAQVTFKANENGSVQNAVSEFQKLVIECLNGSHGTEFPVSNTDSKELKDALKNIQEKESKLLLTLSSEQMMVYGPSQSVSTIANSFKRSTNMSPSFGALRAPHQDKSPSIRMSIKDPLLHSGLSVEENCWKLTRTSFGEKLAMIKEKFGVDFQESGVSQGQVQVKAHSNRNGDNASMESHALRALLQLYLKIATSPLNFTQPRGASSGAEFNRKPGYNIHYTDEPKGEGATAGDNKEEDNCPICMDTFNKKKQLKCKHEFCEECLELSKERLGPFCPVCKDVFGKMEGDQPKGKMDWSKMNMPLPGYPKCGHIIIFYSIPSGTQTEKHPNPGRLYEGISRQAYLPDNKEGNEVLQLLKKAFDQKLIFTVGTSRTTGRENQVTWNDIHHKTSPSGGPQGFGYPDPDYLSRVRDELKAKGIV